jgi:hypothetical protein
MPRPRNNADPEIQRFYHDKKKREAESLKQMRELERPVIADLRRCEIKAKDLNSLKVALPAAAVEVLLGHLLRLSADPIPGLKGTHSRENLYVQDQIVRCLYCAESTFDGRPLAEAFDNSWDESLRWIILAVIADQKPSGITDWLEELRKTPRGKTLKDLEGSQPRRRK